MGLFSFGKKSSKKVMVLMMDCSQHGELQHVMNQMAEKEKFYAMDSVRQNFILLVYGSSLKKYKKENVTGLFPDQWDAPIYRKNDPKMPEIAKSCVRDYIRKTMPGLDADALDIVINDFPGQEYAGASFEYGDME